MSESTVEALPAPKPNLIRKLYDWVIGWAGTPYGPVALMALSFAESSFFPVPPDVLLIALGIGRPRRSFYYALICSVASVAGGVLGYTIGYAAWESVGRPIVDFFNGQTIVMEIRDGYSLWGFWAILAAAITPIPYKIFTITSGLFEFPFGQFMLASAIGRPIRFFAVGGLIYFFGPSIKRFIDKYFNLAAVIFVLVLIGGFVCLKFLSGDGSHGLRCYMELLQGLW